MKSIEWFGHSAIKIVTDNDKILYFDPYNININDQADYIFITHSHFDHFSVPDILKIARPTTKILVSFDYKFADLIITKLFKPYDDFEDEFIKVKTIPAYNHGKRFHPKSNNWVGYIVSFDNITVYHSGDTDIIPEMRETVNVDIAFLPIGGTYTMDFKEAARAVNEIIKPKKIMAIHYDSDDAFNKFSELIDPHQLLRMV